MENKPIPNKTLVAQPSKAPTRKQFWTMISASLVTIGFWVLKEWFGHTAPPEIVGTVVTMAGAIVGYVVHDRANH